ncbi:hypothetical protein [Streptomyces sp. NPDC059247]|uniref:hypothetical protein n=1 Tax=Streptomyces sp. NPDC059247 TaxID=3346790 RepID=UPI0036920363
MPGGEALACGGLVEDPPGFGEGLAVDPRTGEPDEFVEGVEAGTEGAAVAAPEGRQGVGLLRLPGTGRYVGGGG